MAYLKRQLCTKSRGYVAGVVAVRGKKFVEDIVARALEGETPMDIAVRMGAHLLLVEYCLLGAVESLKEMSETDERCIPYYQLLSTLTETMTRAAPWCQG
jgi:hypothetical protein